MYFECLSRWLCWLMATCMSATIVLTRGHMCVYYNCVDSWPHVCLLQFCWLVATCMSATIVLTRGHMYVCYNCVDSGHMYVCYNCVDSGPHVCLLQLCSGPSVSDKGWYVPWYKPSRHKQVSDTQNVWNCHKQVLNNETIWNVVSNDLQYTVGTPYNTAPYITGSNIARLGHGSQNSWSKLWIPVVKSAPVRVIFMCKVSLKRESTVAPTSIWEHNESRGTTPPWSLDVIVTFLW